MAGPFKYVDLFAGCGGLSLGLEQAGFELALAVEKSPMAAETFYHNFIERITSQAAYDAFAAEATSVEAQAGRKLVVKELGAVLGCKPLLSRLRKEGIDLVAGGPPCQGFSLAGRRNPDDLRNKLPWQFLEFVEAVAPKAVIIENVSGMSQDFKKHGQESPFDQLRLALTSTGDGYEVQPVLLNAMHFGAPQHRPRVMLLGLRKDVAAALGFKGSEHTWKSDYDQVGSLLFPTRPRIVPQATHFGDDILGVADAISDLTQKGYSRKHNTSAFAKDMREDTSWMPASVREAHVPGKLKNHALRKHAPAIETRFRLYQYFRDEGIHTKVMAIPKQEDIPEAGRRVRVAEALAGARFPAKAPDGTVIAEDLDGLVDTVMSLGTRKHSQRPLSWNAPSPTVVSLPDDYVHPEEPRTLTVREMARFQSFPDAFEFRAKETTGSLRRRFEVPQYTQVGNAVPPRMARAVGLSMASMLEAASVPKRKKAV
jgi:DNA (cytosine-5)-methyltransferase 1